jgi:hypothetical protein
MDLQGRVSALIGKSAHAIQMITAGLDGNRSMGGMFFGTISVVIVGVR